jgi:hypothetical protein
MHHRFFKEAPPKHIPNNKMHMDIGKHIYKRVDSAFQSNKDSLQKLQRQGTVQSSVL